MKLLKTLSIILFMQIATSSFSQSCEICCLDSVNISNSLKHINGTYQSASYLSSNAKVEAVFVSDLYSSSINDNPTFYKANDFIILQNDFEATGTVNFTAEIESCTEQYNCDAIDDYPWISFFVYYDYYGNPYDYVNVSKCTYNDLCIIKLSDFGDGGGIITDKYYDLYGNIICIEDTYLVPLYYDGCEISASNCVTIE